MIKSSFGMILWYKEQPGKEAADLNALLAA